MNLGCGFWPFLSTLLPSSFPRSLSRVKLGRYAESLGCADDTTRYEKPVVTLFFIAFPHFLVKCYKEKSWYRRILKNYTVLAVATVCILALAPALGSGMVFTSTSAFVSAFASCLVLYVVFNADVMLGECTERSGMADVVRAILLRVVMIWAPSVALIAVWQYL